MDIKSVGDIYQQLSKANLHTLEDVYHPDVVFEDSAHRIEGWQALKHYFETLYTNVHTCQFDIKEYQQVDDTGFLTWLMTLEHPKLRNGTPVHVRGVSHLKMQEGKVIYHRDYFDLGEMLYEHLPVLGMVIKGIKRRLGS